MSYSQIKKALNLLTHGVYIIGVKYGKKINGMTAAWVSQVSSQPPMVSVAIGKTHYTSELISKAKSFSVNIPSPNQMELARKCGFISGKNQDKLQEEEIISQSTGSPILSECATYLDCTLFHQFEVGDHVLFVGTVVEANTKNQSVLIFRSGDFFN